MSSNNTDLPSISLTHARALAAFSRLAPIGGDTVMPALIGALEQHTAGQRRSHPVQLADIRQDVITQFGPTQQASVELLLPESWVTLHGWLNPDFGLTAPPR